jgi:hypothetical protein
MPRLRDEYKVANICVGDIKPEIVPLSQEKNLKNALFNTDGEREEQVEEIKVFEIDDPVYKYQYQNGRRRGETIRTEEGDKGIIRAIIVPFVDTKTTHIRALIANAGTSNYPGESCHCAYLRDTEHMSAQEISTITGMTLNVIRDRLLVYDNLIPEVFELFNEGVINFSAAWVLTKLNSKQQKDILKLYEQDKIKLTQKEIWKYKKSLDEVDLNTLFETFTNDEVNTESEKGQTFTVGIVLTPKQMEDILEGNSIMVTYKGKDIQLCQCEW